MWSDSLFSYFLSGNAASLLLYAAPMYLLYIYIYIYHVLNFIQKKNIFFFFFVMLLRDFCVTFRLTFKRVVKKKSTQEFSCIPYINALVSCLFYTWYGLPVVSRGLENFPLITINGVGVLLESLYILIYLWFSSSERKASSINTFNHTNEQQWNFWS